MYGVLLTLHILVSLALIGIVLMQSGKGGGLTGGAFGGSAQTVFGGRGATDVVTRATIVLGGIFFVTSLVLAMMTSGFRGQQRSLIQERAQQTQSAPGTAPAPAPSAVPPSTTPWTPSGQPSGGGQAPQGNTP
jgi:preprotein translocase subunit SecG